MTQPERPSQSDYIRALQRLHAAQLAADAGGIVSPLYFVERTTRTGQWATQCVTTRRRRALQIARVAAQHHEDKRRYVTVRVRAAHEMPCYIAGWINGEPAWGEAFR